MGSGLSFLLPLNLRGYGSQVPAEETVSRKRGRLKSKIKKKKKKSRKDLTRFIKSPGGNGAVPWGPCGDTPPPPALFPLASPSLCSAYSKTP